MVPIGNDFSACGRVGEQRTGRPGLAVMQTVHGIEQMRAARRAGGDRSFGSGGYAGTPLAEILPVRLPRSDAPPSRLVAEGRFSPEVDAELVVFQNLPEFRSVPQVAHAHVFFRLRSAAALQALKSLRVERRLRSPWCEAERLGGRAEEVGF